MARMLGAQLKQEHQYGFCCIGHDGRSSQYLRINRSRLRKNEKRFAIQEQLKDWQESEMEYLEVLDKFSEMEIDGW